MTVACGKGNGFFLSDSHRSRNPTDVAMLPEREQASFPIRRHLRMESNHYLLLGLLPFCNPPTNHCLMMCSRLGLGTTVLNSLPSKFSTGALATYPLQRNSPDGNTPPMIGLSGRTMDYLGVCAIPCTTAISMSLRKACYSERPFRLPRRTNHLPSILPHPPLIDHHLILDQVLCSRLPFFATNNPQSQTQ